MTIQTWSGREVRKEIDTLEHIHTRIPTFEREPFITGMTHSNETENEYLDTIVKRGDSQDLRAVPIATVSKNYTLVQHREVVDSLKYAFTELGCDPAKLEADLSLTEYGERMWLEITAPDILSFDPGDGHPLELRFHAINSVDGSLRLSLNAGWHRLICDNGMMRLSHERKVQRRHTKKLGDHRITDFLSESLEDMEGEPEQYKHWHTTQPSIFAIQNWIRETVRATWGNNLAARAHHIISSGRDGVVYPGDLKDNALKLTPDKMRVDPAEQVPGQPERASSKWEILNAITFLASHQDSMTARHKMMMQVPEIIEKLKP